LVSAKIIKKLSRFDSSWVKTITFYNGKEFIQHKKIAKALNVKSYFTRPYTSQDKGTLENRIGVISRFFQRKLIYDKQAIKESVKWTELLIKGL